MLGIYTYEMMGKKDWCDVKHVQIYIIYESYKLKKKSITSENSWGK